MDSATGSSAANHAAPGSAVDSAALLAVKGLCVVLRGENGPVFVVRDVSFEVRPGEILGVVGESGAGKSITGTALTGLIEAPLSIAAGEVWYRGRRIDNLPSEAKRKLRGAEIATMFQDPLTALNPVFTIGRQLIETIREHADLSATAARNEAINLMSQVGIPAPEMRLASYPHEFSGGMRQRVVIALALAGNPKLIIADEPTTALDVSIQGQIIALLYDLCQRRGAAVILITHDMGVVASAAQRIAVMYAGRIVEIGPVAEILKRPLHPYTLGLMGSIPSVGSGQKRLVQIEGAMPRLDAIPAGCAFAPRCGRVMPICRERTPELQPHDFRSVACWAAEPVTGLAQ